MNNAYDANSFTGNYGYGYGFAPAFARPAAGFGYPGGMTAAPHTFTQPSAGMSITPTGTVSPTAATPTTFSEQSLVENILRLNLGKIATLYMTYENNVEWNAKIFKGKLEAAGRDHIIISDVTTGKRVLLLTLNLDYITFDEELNYFNTPGVPLPR
ncbi:spore coat protein GerQ [Gorillibacterium massiliense]|uniref:spore coat protein GerQ n=1 Tax=Gorillibacterium massiliense TaxID=1280390 RepID=UPI0004B1A6CE|nr:spore coat protein GerQ [Gorillibacterium massiliense]